MSAKNFSICISLAEYDIEAFYMCLSSSNEDAKASGKSSAVFQLLGMYRSRMLQLQISLEILTCYALDSMHADEEESRKTRSSGGLAQLSSRGPAAGAIMPTFDVPRRVMPKSSRTQIRPIFFQVQT
jgi:hypothetical protein